MTTMTRVLIYGPRDIQVSDELMDELIEKLVKRYGSIEIMSGGAAGADRIGARAAIRNNIPYMLVLPHRDYYAHYKRTNPRMYGGTWTDKIVEHAASTVYIVGGKPFHWSMNFVRNIKMADSADQAVVITNHTVEQLLASTKGGTSHMTKQWTKRHDSLIVVNPEENRMYRRTQR